MSKKATFGCVLSIPSPTRFCTMSATCQSTRRPDISCLSFGGGRGGGRGTFCSSFSQRQCNVDSTLWHYDTQHRKIACNRMQSHAIPWDCMGLHEIACNFMKLHFSANLYATTVWIFECALGTRSGNERLPEVFLHDNWKDLILFLFYWVFLIKAGMRIVTKFWAGKRVSSLVNTRWLYQSKTVRVK